MVNNLPIQNPPLADQVYEIIFKSILSGEYPPGSKLPSENQLAERYQVSRPTIRTAFSRLGELGYVIKKRGVGTFVTKSPNLVNPLYLSYNVMERISSSGYKPGFHQLSAQVISAGKTLSEQLDILTGSSISRRGLSIFLKNCAANKFHSLSQQFERALLEMLTCQHLSLTIQRKLLC